MKFVIKKIVLITPGQFDEPNAVYDTNSFIKYENLNGLFG